MILYAVIARAKDGIVLVESAVAGVEGNFRKYIMKVVHKMCTKVFNFLSISILCFLKHSTNNSRGINQDSKHNQL